MPSPRLTAALFVLLAAPAMAQSYSDPGVGVGFHAGAGRALDATDARPEAGAHARLRITGGIGVEVAAAWREDTYRRAGSDILRVWQVPVQASFLLFLPPTTRVQPYLLAGAGYYRIGARALAANVSGGSENRFAFHAGAGVDVRVARAWSLFRDGRFSFLDVDAVGALGLRARRWDAVAGVNRYF